MTTYFIDGVGSESTIIATLTQNAKLAVCEVFCDNHETIAETIVNALNRTPSEITNKSLDNKALRYAFAAYEEEYTDAINDEGVDCIAAEQRGIAKAISSYLEVIQARNAA